MRMLNLAIALAVLGLGAVMALRPELLRKGHRPMLVPWAVVRIAGAAFALLGLLLAYNALAGR